MTVENSIIGTVFVNSAPSATATNGVVHGQLTITGENTKITYLSGEEEAADKLDKFGNNGSLVKIDSGSVDTIFDMGSYAISGGTFKTEVKPEWCAPNFEPETNEDGTYGVKHFYVAQIGNTQYETLQAAFDAVATNGTIILLHDVTVTETLKFDKTYNNTPVVLEMKGYSIIGNGCRALQIVSGNLEIKGKEVNDTDSIITSTGIAINNSVIRVGGTTGTQSLSLTNGVTVKTGCSYGIAVFGDGTETLSVENSKVISTAAANKDYDGCAISTLGSDTTAADITIKAGAQIEAENTNAIYMPSGDLTVEDGEITGTTGIYVKSGKTTIKGGKITGNGAKKEYTYYGNGGISTGDALVIESCDYPNGAPTATVNGGVFSSVNAEPIGSYAATETSKVTGFVSGGTFNKAVAAELLSSNYVCVYNAETTLYGVVEKTNSGCVAVLNDVYYTTLDAAIAAAADGNTVTLVKNVDTPETTYVISKSITVDLNGMTVTGGGYDGVFQITGENADVHIKNGKIVAVEQNKYTMAVWACAAGCKVTLEDLDISQNITNTSDPQMDMIYTSAGTIIINSGAFESGTPKWTLNCLDKAYKDGTANIIVNGGTFVGYDPRNAENEGKGTSFVAPGVGVSKDADGKFIAQSGKGAQIVDANGGSVNAYGTLSEALAAVTADQTIKLLAAATQDGIFVKTGVTLDLNGNCLTAGMVAVNGTIIDSSEGNATLTIDKDALFIYGENSNYLPLYDKANGAYRFYSFKLTAHDEATANGDVLTFWYKLTLANKAGYQYFADANANGGAAMYAIIGWTGSEANSWRVDFKDIIGQLATQTDEDIERIGGVWVSVYLKNYKLVGNTTFNSSLVLESKSTVEVAGASYEYQA